MKVSTVIKRSAGCYKYQRLCDYVKKHYQAIYIIACLVFFAIVAILLVNLLASRKLKNFEPIASANRIENPEKLDSSMFNGTLSSQYPTITAVKDGIGNVNYGSLNKGNLDYWKNPSIKVGEQLNISVEVNSPNSVGVNYKFEYQVPGGTFRTIENWGEASTVDFIIPSDAVGRWLYIKVSIMGIGGNIQYEEYDDFTYLIYEVNPKDVVYKIYPVIEDTRDDKGNVNTNSWGANEGGDWPNGLSKFLNVGESIAFSINTNDPNEDNMEYKFEMKVDGGEFLLLKDWDSNNSYIWTVPEEYSGKKIVIMCSVKDSDEYFLFSQADDYNYLVYQIR